MDAYEIFKKINKTKEFINVPVTGFQSLNNSAVYYESACPGECACSSPHVHKTDDCAYVVEVKL